MVNIVIIGFENIGKRHLEACIKNKSVKRIYIIEKYISQIKNINFNKINKEILVLNKIQKLDDSIYLTIIATDSLNRYTTTINFLRANHSKYILFEKFLFNNLNHYNYINSLLKNKKIKAYVNCNRRISQDYIKIKNNYGKKINHIIVEGNKWNFMSNSIHFIDLFMFLTNAKKIKIESVSFKKKIKSSRKNYNEIHGEISFSYKKKKLTVIDSPILKKNKITMITKNMIIEIFENEKLIVFSDSNNLKINKIIMKDNLFVSNTTNKILNNLFKYKDSRLVDFSSSVVQHKTFIKALNKMFKDTILHNNYLIT